MTSQQLQRISINLPQPMTKPSIKAVTYKQMTRPDVGKRTHWAALCTHSSAAADTNLFKTLEQLTELRDCHCVVLHVFEPLGAAAWTYVKVKSHKVDVIVSAKFAGGISTSNGILPLYVP